MAEEEINLLNAWRTLWRGKAVVVLVTLALTLLALGVSLVLPKTYRAEAVILPLGGQKGGGGLTAAVSQMGLGGLLGGMGAGATNSAQILAILRSRTLAERVIAKYDLLKVLFAGDWDATASRWKDPQNPPNMEAAVKEMMSLLNTMDDKKSQTIKIAAVTRQPETSARIVNGMLTELYEEIKNNSFTVQKRNRIFIEGQLERNKADLLEVGKELSSFYTTNRIPDTHSQIDVDVRVAKQEGASPETKQQAALPPSMAGVEVQVMPQELQAQIDDLKRQLDKVSVVHEVPQQIYLQYLTMRQELIGRMNALLTQQYEMAKIEESKEDLSFQVIDWARVPIRKFAPKRAQIVIAAFVLSSFLSVFYVFLSDYYRKIKDSES